VWFQRRWVGWQLARYLRSPRCRLPLPSHPQLLAEPSGRITYRVDTFSYSVGHLNIEIPLEAINQLYCVKAHTIYSGNKSVTRGCDVLGRISGI
jgi:hypothetical protein